MNARIQVFVYSDRRQNPGCLVDEFGRAWRHACQSRSMAFGRLVAGGVTAVVGRPPAGAQRSPAGVGPDWAVVEEYLDEQRGWTEGIREHATTEVSSDELSRSALESVPDAPDAGRAMAAATAILEQGGAHEKTVEAAEFLIEHGRSVIGGRQHMYAGARALLEHAPGYGDWPQVLSRMDAGRILGGTPIDTFFEELASAAQDPALRATGRYYVAAGLMRAANGLGSSPAFFMTSNLGPTADTEAQRQRALEVATGLSAGVEEERFLGGIPHGPFTPMTLAEVEADLVRSIRHGTVGGTLPDVTGKRLDGVRSPWRTTAGGSCCSTSGRPGAGRASRCCRELRELVADVPADRFALIAISVDEELETVTRFMENEPMPWVNWHVGITSDIGRLLRVVGYPTYVLRRRAGEDPGQDRGLRPRHGLFRYAARRTAGDARQPLLNGQAGGGQALAGVGPTSHRCFRPM